MQQAYAEYLKTPENYLNLGRFYQQKRDRFMELIRAVNLKEKLTQEPIFNSWIIQK